MDNSRLSLIFFIHFISSNPFFLLLITFGALILTVIGILDLLVNIMVMFLLATVANVLFGVFVTKLVQSWPLIDSQ